MATSTAPHLDQLEAADTLRDHVFTLVRAGEMNAALILIRADVHAAALALAGRGRCLRVMPVEGVLGDPGPEEPDDAEDAPPESADEETTDSEDAAEKTTEDVDDPVKPTPAVPDATTVAAMVG